jgi:hypothetical protein
VRPGAHNSKVAGSNPAADSIFGDGRASSAASDGDQELPRYEHRQLRGERQQIPVAGNERRPLSLGECKQIVDCRVAAYDSGAAEVVEGGGPEPSDSKPPP